MDKLTAEQKQIWNTVIGVDFVASVLENLPPDRRSSTIDMSYALDRAFLDTFGER